MLSYSFVYLFTERLTSELNYREQLSAELLVKLERWPEANAAYRSLLLWR